MERPSERAMRESEPAVVYVVLRREAAGQFVKVTAVFDSHDAAQRWVGTRDRPDWYIIEPHELRREWEVR